MKVLRALRNTRSLGLRYFSDNVSKFPPDHPVDKTLRSLRLKRVTDDDLKHTHCDVVIIGGGGMGCSIAYWLKELAGDNFKVVVLEKDPTYSKASTVLSVGGLRQQFSLEENIRMSLFGAEFIRKINDYLKHDVNVNFTPYGYLMLASEEGADQLEKNSALQRSLGAKNELLGPQLLKKKFPWLNTEGIALGCHGLENEGWFDPWALLSGLRTRAKELGTIFQHAEAVEFEFEKKDDIMVQGVELGEYEPVSRVIVREPDGNLYPIKFAICVIAAGPQSGHVARLAKIGTGEGLLSIPLPVEPRKRYVYSFECQHHSPPGLNTPLTIDPTNTYFRRDGLGGRYICGRSPDPDKEPPVDNLDVDMDYFEQNVWPHLAHRVPCFEAIKVKSAWAGYYEYNTFDENGIIGLHPYHNNTYIATGFSGHGIQQVPAVGRAVAEMVLGVEHPEIDLSRFGFDRLILDKPMWESNIV